MCPRVTRVATANTCQCCPLGPVAVALSDACRLFVAAVCLATRDLALIRDLDRMLELVCPLVTAGVDIVKCNMSLGDLMLTHSA